MKKLGYVIVIIALLGLLLCACQGKTAGEEQSTVSYMQSTFYLGRNADFVVRLVGGESEEMFVADGKAQDCRPFCTLTLVPLHVDLFNDAYSFVLTGDKGTAEGELAKDSFGASYSVEIADPQAIGTPLSIAIHGGSTQENIELQNLLQDAITGEKAMEIAQETICDKLAADDKDREIYVKYINDTAKEDSPYYWYVAFIAAPTDYYSVLVDQEGKVVAVNP